MVSFRKVQYKQWWHNLLGLNLTKERPLFSYFIDDRYLILRHKSPLMLLKSVALTSSFVGAFIIGMYFLTFEQARFFFPDNPVPVTLQTFGILLMGSIYGLRLSFISISFYLILGISGVPIFQGHNGGIEYAMGVTGGYLIGFFLASLLNSFLSTRGFNRGLSIWSMLASNMVIYLPALIWLSVGDFSWPEEGKLYQAILPFLLGDFIKLIGASIVISFLWRLVGRSED